MLAVAAFVFIALSASGRGAEDRGEFVDLFAVGPVLKPVHERADHNRCLRPSDLRAAERFAARRQGSVGFAALDECGRLVGVHRNRAFASASVVKVMLMTAYLRQGDVPDRDLSDAERDLLGAMITISDNDAADEVFAMVGEGGLDAVAHAAAMQNFASSPFWGGSGITAADQAAFVGRLEHYVPKRHEDFALRLMREVIPDQTWGVVDVRPKGWRVGFKGGWYMAADGWRVNQVARLTRRKRSLALAILTDQDPSFEYGRETIAGVAERLLDAYR